MKLKIIICFALFVNFAVAQEEHTSMMHDKHKKPVSNIMLTEAGNDAFGTIQEVIVQLNNDPNTNWQQVNIEALRQHLLDMHDMTLNIEVLAQTPIDNGLKAVIRPTTTRAELALDRVFKAHPVQLERETGWKMQVIKNDDHYALTIISKNPKDVDKIRGLGYIGLMAYGNHHQPHHLAMATGNNPHAGHH